MARLIDAILDKIKPVQKIQTAPPPRFSGPIYGAAAPKNIPGLVAPGNTDLSKLPVVRNPPGSFGAKPGQSNYSTVHSMGFMDENPKSPYYQRQVLARGMVGNKTTDDVNAVRQEYERTGKHLGIFSANPTQPDPWGNEYGEKLHSDWASGYIPGVAMGTDSEGPKNVLGKTPIPRPLFK